MVLRSSLTLPQASLPELWGGEVGLVTHQMSTNGTQNDSRLTQLSNGIGQPDTLTTTDILIEKYYTRSGTESITSQSSNNKGAIAQTIVLSKEQSTVESLGTDNENTLTPVKSTTEHAYHSRTAWWGQELRLSFSRLAERGGYCRFSDQNFSKSLQPRFPTVATESGEGLLVARELCRCAVACGGSYVFSGSVGSSNNKISQIGKSGIS